MGFGGGVASCDTNSYCILLPYDRTRLNYTHTKYGNIMKFKHKVIFFFSLFLIYLHSLYIHKNMNLLYNILVYIHLCYLMQIGFGVVMQV